MMQNPKNLIGPAIRRLRVARNLSQPAFAAFLQREGWNVSESAIAKIENQTRQVLDFEIGFLAAVLDVAVEDLFPKL